MLLAIILAGAIWLGGRALDLPRAARWQMLGLLYIAILAVNVALPEGNALRAATGGSAGEWLVLGGLAVGVLSYRAGLGRLRTRARAGTRDEAPRPGLGSAERERYARHIVLREIGGAGQRRLQEARVLVVGAGGLGSPALQYLAAAGVGTIGVIDDDIVEVTNLQRQVIHLDARIGTPKVFSAQAAITAQNPFVTVRPYNRRLTDEIATDLVADYDLVLDGTDDLDTRYLVNEAAFKLRRPVIGGALSQWEGQVATFAPHRGGPCYACLFPRKPDMNAVATCAEAGVLGPLPGVVGAMMAVEAVKELTEAGAGLVGRLVIYDALWGETRTMTVAPRADCPVCGGARLARRSAGRG